MVFNIMAFEILLVFLAIVLLLEFNLKMITEEILGRYIFLNLNRVLGYKPQD